MSAGQRADVQPPRWEVPTALAAVWLVASALIFPVGQGIAGQLVGAGWVWPHTSTALMVSIGGLLTGHPGRGLLATQARRVPSALVVYSVIGVGELLLILATVWAGWWWWHQLGPGARAGMAGRAQVQAVLGVGRLRAARTVIRPDLYTPNQRPKRGISR